MAGEQEEIVVDKGAAEGGEPGDDKTQGQEGVDAGASAIDPQEYQRIQSENQTLVQNWQKLEALANRDEVFRKELERAWKGLPPKEQAQIAQQARQPEKPKTNQNQSNKELEDIRAQLKEWKQTQERQQVESLRREKFSEVQDETNRAFQKFEATPADQQEFWKRYGAMVQNEAQTYMQNGMPLPQAMQKAQYNHSFNIAGEYALLMEDKLATLWSKKAQERNSPLRGIASPADKQGAPGVMPGVKERFLAAIKNEKSAEKRAQMYVEFGREFGEPNGGFFKSSGGI